MDDHAKRCDSCGMRWGKHKDWCTERGSAMPERKRGAFEAYSLDFVIDEARKYLADRDSDIEEGDWLRILDAASRAAANDPEINDPSKQSYPTADSIERLYRQAYRQLVVERKRQIDEEGFDQEHDDEYEMNELYEVAVCYLREWKRGERRWGRLEVPEGWPWSPQWWKPEPHDRMLIKAGALAMAEHERLLRLDNVDNGMVTQIKRVIQTVVLYMVIDLIGANVGGAAEKHVKNNRRTGELKPRFHTKAGYLKNSILEVDDLEGLETGMRVNIIGSVQLTRKVAGFSEGDDLSPSVFIHPNTTLNEVVLAVFYDPETI